MQVTWFVTYTDKTNPEAEVTQAEVDKVREIVSSTRGLANGVVSTPWMLSGLPFDDKPVPQLSLQLYFDDIEDLEKALEADGHLQALADPALLPTFTDVHVVEQAMLARKYPSPNPKFETKDGEPHCTFLVHYPGPAEDPSAWLRHYVVHHTAIMKTFPAIRQIEVCTRLDWCSFMPWERENNMLRNKVVFDDGDGLKAALASSVIEDMMADAELLPPYIGGSKHFAMATKGAPNR